MPKPVGLFFSLEKPRRSTQVSHSGGICWLHDLLYLVHLGRRQNLSRFNPDLLDDCTRFSCMLGNHVFANRAQ
jgi:hypothetical protein